MNPRRARTRNLLLLALAAIFAILASAIFSGTRLAWPVLAILGVIVGLLGVVLTVLTVRQRETKTRKTFFILTGVGATGIPVCAILHNLVYGLFIEVFGKDFWGPGGDEPVFFILATIVCPVLFLIGSVGSGILLLKKNVARKET